MTSRKSTRRGTGSNTSSIAERTQLPMPSLSSLSTGADPVQLRYDWGAPLTPVSNTAARRSTTAATPSTSFAGISDGGVPARGGSCAETLLEPEEGDATPSHRWKRRRTEQISFASLQKEVFMYLDTVATTQYDQQRGSAAMSAAEKEAISTQWPQPQQQQPSLSTVFRAHLLFPIGGVNHGGSGGTTHNTQTEAPVEAAVAETLRILRSCWTFNGSPSDAFEPVRLLSPVTVHLLRTYGHHGLTHNGDYLVLHGGAEQLPWVGCLYSILLAYQHRHLDVQAEMVSDPFRSPTASSDLQDVSRVLLLNCHSFGWLDQMGSDEYERSHRRLYQTREALTSLLEDPRYAALGRHNECSVCAATSRSGAATTSVLLGDTIVMEGGAPSLGIARPSGIFTAHYHYGRGLACCVPHTVDGTMQSKARGGLCVMHQQQPVREASDSSGSDGGPRGVGIGHSSVTRDRMAIPNTPPSLAEEDYVQRRGSHYHLQHPSAAPPALGPGATSPLSSSIPLSSPFTFAPVCCGSCRATGVLGQAVLLGPTGPLLVHLQVEAQEWVTAAAQASARGRPPTGAGFSLTALADTPAMCPPPPPTQEGIPAVLYGYMQMERSAALCSRLPPSAPLNSGGSVSLGEFVEWLVRLLRAPPPTLVVEWHSGAAFPLAGSAVTSLYRSEGYHSGGCTSPTTAHYQRQSQAPQHSSLGIDSHHSLSSSPALPSSIAVGVPTASISYAQQQQGRSLQQQESEEEALRCMPLGLTVQPRPLVVPQLLEAYMDLYGESVFDSNDKDGGERGRMPTPPAPPSQVVSTDTPWQDSLSTALHAAAAAANNGSGESRSQASVSVMLDWVRAVQASLHPCEATAFFDGVERPLVLSKGLEVVAEGERYVTPTSVVTSLQFRPHPSRL